MTSSSGSCIVENTDAEPLDHLDELITIVLDPGQTNREIGAELHISRRTVETHLAHAFQELDIRARSSLASLMTSTPDP